MKLHRKTFWITLGLFIILIILIIYIKNEDIKNIVIGIMCGFPAISITEFLILFDQKDSTKDNLCDYLSFMKMYLLQYNYNIDKLIDENEYIGNEFGNYFISNIINIKNDYIKLDSSLFVLKKKILDKSKQSISSYCYDLDRAKNNLYINLLSIKVNNLNNQLLRYGDLDEVAKEQLKNIKNLNNEFMTKIEEIALNLLTKKGLKKFMNVSNSINKTLLKMDLAKENIYAKDRIK